MRARCCRCPTAASKGSEASRMQTAPVPSVQGWAGSMRGLPGACALRPLRRRAGTWGWWCGLWLSRNQSAPVHEPESDVDSAGLRRLRAALQRLGWWQDCAVAHRGVCEPCRALLDLQACAPHAAVSVASCCNCACQTSCKFRLLEASDSPYRQQHDLPVRASSWLPSHAMSGRRSAWRVSTADDIGT